MIVSRVEARRLGLRRYFTGDPCRYGHVAERYTCSMVCVTCQSLANEAWQVPVRQRRIAQRAMHRKMTWDWNFLTDAQKEIWYQRVNLLRQNKQKQYRHHPLEEDGALLIRR